MTKQKSHPQVVGLGNSAIDYLALVPHFPERDKKMRMLDFKVQGGGPVATALVTLARFGISTGYVGKVGGDNFGKFILHSLEKEGVDISRVVVDERSSSLFAFVIIEKKTGRRTILWTKGDSSPLKTQELDEDYLLSAKVLHFDGYEVESSIWIAKKAKIRKVKLTLDLDTIVPDIDELVSLCDVVIPSWPMASKLTGEDKPEEAVKKIRSMGPGIVAITLGEKGCICSSDKETFFQPGIKVKAVDTTGAGDVFHGAFIFGLLQGWDLRKIAKFSNIVAALNCTKLGGREGIPDLNKALDLLQKME